MAVLCRNLSSDSTANTEFMGNTPLKFYRENIKKHEGRKHHEEKLTWKNQIFANYDILKLITDCCNASSMTDEKPIKCYSFYTDGGTDCDSNNYFLY